MIDPAIIDRPIVRERVTLGEFDRGDWVWFLIGTGLVFFLFWLATGDLP